MVQTSWVGQVLGGRYKIEELLGKGGMSSVYKATDPNLRRVVAVKMIHPHLSDNEEFVSRFEEEAAAVAQLRHPNIIQVFDFETDGDISYMVLEFVPGETLQARLKRLNAEERRMDYVEVVKYAIGVCEAVDYAHKRGMIHRDIKPANIMLDVYGKAILMDFGIAKIVGGQQHTATGAVIGTALYMSPEQIRGESPDQRADIYSIGVTLYEMISGHPPYEADSAMTLMMKHLNDPIPDLRTLHPDVPSSLVAVVEKALAKDRQQRFQTAAEMAAALNRVLAELQGDIPEGATVIEQAPVDSVDATVIESPAAVADVEGTLIEQQPSLESTQPTGDFSKGTTARVDYSPESLDKQVSLGKDNTQVAPSVPSAAGTGGLFRSKGLLIGGGVFIALLVIVGGFLIFGSSGGNGDKGVIAGGSATETAQSVALVNEVTEEPTEIPTVIPTQAPSTPTSPPTDIPTPTLSPTPTIPPGIPYVLITSIALEGDTYVVEYQTFEYTPQLPGEHIHFFFDTVPPEQAGVPGSGPWILYGGPSPFTGYRTINRPADATMMCALVANANHSVQPDSGNCFLLPDVISTPENAPSNSGG